MSKVDRLPEQEQAGYCGTTSAVRLFVQRRGYWLRIPILLGGAAAFYWVGASHGVRMLQSKSVLLIFGVILANVLVSLVFAARTPREFEVRGGVVIARWNRHEERIYIGSVSSCEVPFFEFDGLVTFWAGGRLYVVVEEMEGFKDFLELLQLG